MNKAFVREPDDVDTRCPRCQVIGQPVARHTVLAHLSAEAAARLSDSACFCANPRCDAAYYDALEQSVPVSELIDSLFPKDPTAPICSCFKVMPEEIEADAKAKRVDRVKQLIARSQSSEAKCDTAAANGGSCAGEVQRYYLKCSK